MSLIFHHVFLKNTVKSRFLKFLLEFESELGKFPSSCYKGIHSHFILVFVWLFFLSFFFIIPSLSHLEFIWICYVRVYQVLSFKQQCLKYFYFKSICDGVFLNLSNILLIIQIDELSYLHISFFKSSFYLA